MKHALAGLEHLHDGSVTLLVLGPPPVATIGLRLDDWVDLLTDRVLPFA